MDRYNLPEGIFVEITNICNLRCEFCPSRFSERPKGFMEFKIFQRIVDELKENKAKYVNLWMLGEPLLHPQILEFINYVENKGLWAAIITNGTLFNEKREIFKKLLNDFKHITISISYYGSNQNTFNLIEANVLDLPTYKNNVSWFIEECLYAG